MKTPAIKLFSTVFYIGNSPFAPGTLASAAGGLLWVILHGQPLLYVALFIGITILGFLICGPMEDVMGRKDPGCVVIDEISGIMISFFLLPLELPVLITAFFLFRAFDMFKLYPVNKCEEIEGGVGIMMDDVVAGIYTFLTMHAALFLRGLMF